MHETKEDLDELQRLLDRSFASAGEHLRGIWSEERRMTAEQLVASMGGMRILDVATVTAKGEPRVAPVDGLFFRGQLWFGSSPTAARVRHLRARPVVSVSHARGEELAVVAHGRALEVPLGQPRAAFQDYLREVYGPGWDDWGYQDAPYFRVEPAKLFASFLPSAG